MNEKYVKAVRRYHRNLTFALGVILLIFILIPLFVKSPYILNIFILVFYMSTLSMAWNLLGGMTGQNSFPLCSIQAVYHIETLKSILGFSYRSPRWRAGCSFDSTASISCSICLWTFLISLHIANMFLCSLMDRLSSASPR